MSARRTRVLELAVLGLLYEAPLHGYELRKRLTFQLGAFRAFSYGSLYPCLKEMLRQGHVSQTPQAEGSARGGRRSRIVYRLTDTGHEHLHGLLTEVAPATSDDECFGVHFALFGHTGPDVRLRILHGRRDRLHTRLADLRARLAHAPGPADDYTFELYRHDAESVEREIHWLDGLIAREQRDARSRPGPAPPRPGPPV
ncbi:PadR family transcriptional regulator [Actinorugispora endophytica]|uniref:PadR family transcriptional regulator n=1 Tax=Actinorugispora endophytica TaxID=1605990 RepID=A0A4R6V588_9ACTN|nr:PadR family transcriptional regulator [Actinorugispora endophytica]TDQ55511.1 PadR family transcriptional regulator [Actinorugispora endophytica]